MQYRKADTPAQEIPVIFIMGPTATGKTDAAAYLSECFPVELISVDSSLVYRGMDIGTAKPDKKFLQRYPHHLVDIREPDQTYSVADFVEDTVKLIKTITEKGKIPILVGGTSFYFSAIEKGIPELPGANEQVRAQINTEAERIGWRAMHAKLAAVDSRSALRIDVNDPQRIQRALEVVRLTGAPVQPVNPKPVINNSIIKIALSFSNRQILHNRIKQRFDMMVKAGLIEEIEALLRNYSKEIPAFKMIGYRQGIDFIENKIDMTEFLETSAASTRQLAKRQLTWLRNQSGLIWWSDDDSLQSKNFKGLTQLLKAFGI